MITEIEVESSEKVRHCYSRQSCSLTPLRGLPEQPITLQVNGETFGTEIISDNGRYKLSGENPIDFPKTPVVNRGQSVDFFFCLIGIGYFQHFVCNQHRRSAPGDDGVFVQMGAESATFAATDGHRLVRYRRTDIKSDVDTSMIIQRKH